MRIEDIKDLAVRELMLKAVDEGKKLALDAGGNSNMAACDLVILGLAKIMVDYAAGKGEQPCQCTNGVIRSIGRDNEEIIEDCPRCSARKEAQP